MEYWSWATDQSLLHAEEVLVASQTDVALYDGDEKTQWKKGKVMLTTHRLLYQELDGQNTTLQLHLQDIDKTGESPSSVNGFAFRSDKIVIPLPRGKHTKISFRKGGMKEFFDVFMRTLRRRSWEKTAPPAPPQGQGQPSAGASTAKAGPETQRPRGTADMVGIAGVMRQSAERSHMQETFKDIDDVMAKASSLVSNIRQLKDRAIASERSGGGASTAQAQEDRVAIESIEATLGLGTMVSSSGASLHGKGQKRFHEELAAELHAWMSHPRNDRMFGEMAFVPLIELFSMYNRARSGDLVAPDDVLHACKCMAKQPYSIYSFQKLSSGRIMLVRKDDTIVLSKIVSLIGPMIASSSEAHKNVGAVPKGARTLATTTTFPRSSTDLKSVNEVMIANALRVAVPVAKDVLESLTKQGYLCVCDAGYGCSTYYWNIFVL